MKQISLIIFAFILFSCQNQPEEFLSDYNYLALSPISKEKTNQAQEGIQLIVLGNDQDACYLHTGCKREGCKEAFEQLTIEEKNKIYLIHLNHTNPLLDRTSKETQTVERNGYHIARFLDTFEL